MLLGLRTAIHPAPDLAAAKSWCTEVLGQPPYFDQPFDAGFAVGGFELGPVPDGTPGVDGPRDPWRQWLAPWRADLSNSSLVLYSACCWRVVL